MIEGTQREDTSFVEQKLYIGLFEGKVVAINPTAEEFTKLTGWIPSESSKQFEYTGVNNRGDYKGVAFHNEFRTSIFLEPRERENKEGTLTQYINDAGTCSWASSPDNLKEWFTRRRYRVARVGEEELYNFIKVWLSGLDTKSPETHLELDWKSLINGDAKELKQQINGEFDKSILAVACIDPKENEQGEIVHYQRVYNRTLRPYSINKRLFNTEDYTNENVIAKLAIKEKQSVFDKFVLEINDKDYGCKQIFTLKPIEVFNPNTESDIRSTDDVKQESDSDF